ncbi:rod shape-determining protein MreC [Macromonas nakdongensis]|uniref:rod shape-determining protein MreC n=1 Tax=Macromonas nakdongensis TaxID=1843082 RepID=UPI000C31C8C9|nr:rod shape-determining protein MreC [Macromonas nakdongensis]
MPLGTVDRTPPPFFKQGPSALSKLLVLSALAVLLMVVDARRQWAAPLRATVAAVLAPVQWLALQPVRLGTWVGHHVGSLNEAQQAAAEARSELVRQAQRASIVEHLAQENRELRTLLGMRERLPPNARGAEILYESPDPYSRKVVIDQGQAHTIQPGSPVMDGYGVLGQVTRVYPTTAEVTLLIDRHQAIPVINTRTGQRSLAYGLPGEAEGRLELRFESVNTDAEPGDILTTSGVDGIYPPGLPVARVLKVSVLDGSGFARIECTPMARMHNTLHVLVVDPATDGRRPPQESRP